ncbi:MAG: 2-oxo acid dehydrogenase subunit E2 [Acidimicrobiia bacterium]|nr:2-oxo acid dehydrogenase subunit E2 [Acidimicrobiia bacterium]MYD41273.1 2-oxo acid dehydrogenase subunit E2 [Acidimicrobiia bacterium]MYG93051.1 2-oxo acid dehydrogenase subunit E2 [Acidimicrobiia bacterium]MYH06074.1 2-oxo acid dehydrogenase subunit E2 [Acidimicrobiia bacterium]MYK55583.1 2-oxo acid dehydrogenase subunit E2 [Acidimicrobiia bacterium]
MVRRIESGPVATEFLLPDIGDGLTEAEVVRWLVGEGYRVARDEPLVEVETDKAVVVIPSPVEGTVLRHGAATGETMAVGAVLAVIGSPEEARSVASGSSEARDGSDARETAPAKELSSHQPTASVRALPVVRRLARQHRVDLSTVQGSGPGGRITREDVLAAAGAPGRAGDPTPETMSAKGEVHRRPLSRLQKTIAANMSRSWSEIPHVTTFDQVDVTRLIAARRSLVQSHGSEVSFDALVIGAVIPALGRFPEFNSTLEGDCLLVHSGRHIGVAINAADGLLVGVLRDADEMSILQIAEGIRGLSDRGRSRNLGVEELTGQTFTVTNFGALGGGFGTPIIPPGNTAILGVGRVADAPVAEDGKVVVRPMMPLSLSFDHRVIDGALSRRFTDSVIANLCEPTLFLP